MLTLAFCCLLELGIRASGLVDVPIYRVAPDIGYLPKASQDGSFMHRNRWSFNDLGMAVSMNWDPTRHPNLLLIGNSIVMGTNLLDQDEKIGTLLQTRLGSRYQVWPIGGSGWTNLNETAYLERYPDVRRTAQCYVWFYMSGGLSGLSNWRGEYVFPDRPPILATWYVIRRYLVPRLLAERLDELPPAGSVSPNAAARLEAQLELLDQSVVPGARIMVLYPTQAELGRARAGDQWLPEADAVAQLAHKHGMTVIDLGLENRWSDEFYRDGVHPVAAGDHVIADLIAARLASLR